MGDKARRPDEQMEKLSMNRIFFGKRTFNLIMVGTLVLTGILNGPVFYVGAQSLPQPDRKRIENYGALFIRAINDGKPEAQMKAVPEVFSQALIKGVGEARLIGLLAKMRQNYGILEYHHSEVTEFKTGGSISRFMHVYAKTKGAKGWKDFQFRLDDDPPHKIKEMAFIADVSEPIALPNGAISDRSTLEWLNGYIDKLIADNDLSGSVLIAVGDKPIYERSFGYADAKRANKVMPDTRFGMASGSKMFTALAVAQLVEKGKLEYGDSLSKFFPDFPNAAFAKKVTVHHLLSHTSGVNEYWTPEYEKNWQTIRDVKGMLPWVYKVGTDFEPGAKFHYSNSNFILAGLIVERVSGMDYYEYIQKHITDPLGMKQTGFYLRDGKITNLAEPLKRKSSRWEIVELGARGTSAGGCFSTPQELLKFARGLAGSKLVTKDTLALLTASKTRGLDAQTDYGYGFELGNQGQVFSFGHGGIARGTNFAFQYFPAEDVTFIAFNNQDNGAYDDLRKNIVKLITGWR